jgi:hypothetical protein
MPTKKVVKQKEITTKKTVHVHTCIEFGEELPTICACRRWITLYQAKRWVRTGLADWISIGKRTFHDKVYIFNKSSQRTPRAATIDKAHIERAYVAGNLQEQVRIKEYGLINQQELAKLIRPVVSSEFDEGKDNDFGRAILYMPNTQRTPGGIGK